MEPALLVNHGLGVLLILIVAHHQTVAFGENLAVVGQFELNAAEHRSHRAGMQLLLGRVVHRNHRRGLRKSISLINLQFRSRERADDALLYGRTTRHHNHRTSAEVVSPFRIYQLVGDAVAQLVN